MINNESYLQVCKRGERERERKREGGETWSERVVRGAARRKKKKLVALKKEKKHLTSKSNASYDCMASTK